MGTAFQEQGELDEAIACYEKALQLEPEYAQAYNNMGTALEDQGRSDEAISCYQQALEIKPDYGAAHFNLFHQLRKTHAWQELESVPAKLDRFTKRALDSGIRPAEAPFMSITRYADLPRNLAIAQSWSLDIAGTMAKLKIHFSFEGRSSHKRRITVGYLSNDFHDHATAHLMLSLFGLHSRDEFDIFCYSYGPNDGSYYRARIRRDCDKFVDIYNLSHAEAATVIYEDQVDILVDLKGYTKGNRLAICALRPAPVQVSYLGFPGTSGADFFDYIITDKIVTPEDHACYYSENFVYLPHCYQVNDHTQSISNKGWKKQDFALPEPSFVFCSFNRAYKIETVMFDSWMKILQQLPDAVLWLQRENEIAEKNLRQHAETRGVDPERLIFAKRLPKDEHLARMRFSDLALDTWIVNGHTTTSDALWAGVPVITLMGGHFASRVSASILTAIGLSELITHTLEEYEALAVRLAGNPGELKALRQKLAKNRLTEPLFDTQRFAKNLEKAYKEMCKIFLAGQKPRQIKVAEH
jgi:protein O-GlcNAc transferase